MKKFSALIALALVAYATASAAPAFAATSGYLHCCDASPNRSAEPRLDGTE
jgi:hypothetical protein